MAEISITTKLEELKVLFNQMKEGLLCVQSQ